MPDDEALIKEVRSSFDYARAYWADIRKQGEIDMRYQTEGPWTDDDLSDRRGRVTLSPDELSQYVNQIVNEYRMNKRGVKMTPRGDGANDESARKRAAMVREIEYASRAQQAYVCAGENMVRRSYGYFKLKTEYQKGSFRRCLRIVRIPNPDVIWLDPDAKEADFSDMMWAFETESYREKDFVKKFGKDAKKQSFTEEDINAAPLWISQGDDGKHIIVAAYYKREVSSKKLYLLQDGREVDGSQEGVESKGKFLLIDGQQVPFIDSRDDDEYKVAQYLTNGIEILKKEPLDFSEVPIIAMFGREKWVTKGGLSRRMYESAIRLARDSYKAFCYTFSAKIERLAQDPKTPYEGFEGQFDTSTDFTSLNRNPQGYVTFKAQTTATGDTILPLPRKTISEPQIQQYEIAQESSRRSIQASMGGSPLPTNAQRMNDKSGVALDKIEQSQDQGNFNFQDNFDMALERGYRLIDEALDIVYDTPQQIAMRDETGDKVQMEDINQVDPQTGQKVGFHTEDGDHGQTISTGPSFQSQRDEANVFIGQLIAHPEILGPNAAKVIALLVKLKDLGPIGDKIAEIIDPQQDSGVPAAVQQAQGIIHQLQQEIEMLKSGDAIKMQIADANNKTKIEVALIQAKQEAAITQLEQQLGMIQKKMDIMADVHQQAADHAHQLEMASNQRQQAMEQSQQQHSQTLEQQQQAADLQPQPEPNDNAS